MSPKLIYFVADECVMEQPLNEDPRRVTPTEARAKLLRSLIAQPAEGQMKEADRQKLAELQIRFLREMANQP